MTVNLSCTVPEFWRKNSGKHKVNLAELGAKTSADATSQRKRALHDPFASTREEQLWGDAFPH